MGQTFVYNFGEAEIDKKKIEVTFGVFIDGTLNNKDNTDMRNVHARGAKKSDEDGYNNIDYSKSNKEIEKSDHEVHAKIKNKLL
jgi:cytoskeletal protein CcmA (bactofilin family)